jgi:hypothetical protein
MIMSEFKKYKRKGLSEMRPYEVADGMSKEISFSPEELKLETLIGGYIARNPKNHKDQWYVAEKYFKENLELAEIDVENFQPRLVDAEPTFGELAVGLSFNPSALSEVDKVKRAFAGLIDICYNISTFTYLGNTLKGMAVRGCIESQMAVVKLITFKEK